MAGCVHGFPFLKGTCCTIAALFSNKWGFRKGDSPAFLLLPLTDRWRLALDEGKMIAYRSVSLSFCSWC